MRCSSSRYRRWLRRFSNTRRRLKSGAKHKQGAMRYNSSYGKRWRCSRSCGKRWVSGTSNTQRRLKSGTEQK